MLLAAAARDETAEPLIGALRAQHIDPELALGEAERRSVLVREPGLVRFRHPLLRTAAWAAATSAEQRAAHAALAAAMPKARRRTRVWHLAAAATEADSALADELERLADEDRDRVRTRRGVGGTGTSCPPLRRFDVKRQTPGRGDRGRRNGR